MKPMPKSDDQKMPMTMDKQPTEAQKDGSNHHCLEDHSNKKRYCRDCPDEIKSVCCKETFNVLEGKASSNDYYGR